MEHIRMIEGKLKIITVSHCGTEIFSCNRCYYQVPAIVGTNSPNKEKHKLYNLTRGIKCDTNVGSTCSRCVNIGAQVKTQVGNGLYKLFDFWIQNIGVSDQGFFFFTYMGLHNE